MQSQKMLGAAGTSHRVSYLYHPSYHGVLKMYSPTFRFWVLVYVNVQHLGGIE